MVHHRISSTDSKVRTTVHVFIIDSVSGQERPALSKTLNENSLFVYTTNMHLSCKFKENLFVQRLHKRVYK